MTLFVLPALAQRRIDNIDYIFLIAGLALAVVLGLSSATYRFEKCSPTCA